MKCSKKELKIKEANIYNSESILLGSRVTPINFPLSLELEKPFLSFCESCFMKS